MVQGTRHLLSLPSSVPLRPEPWALSLQTSQFPSLPTDPFCALRPTPDEGLDRMLDQCKMSVFYENWGE